MGSEVKSVLFNILTYGDSDAAERQGRSAEVRECVSGGSGRVARKK
jgi:hypothetical protein